MKGFILYSKSSYALEQYDKAFEYIIQAQNAATKINDPILASSIITFKGLCYFRLGFYKEADQTLKSVIPIVKTIKNQEDIHYHLASIYSNLAANYEQLGNKKARDLYNEKAYNESRQLEKSNKYLWGVAVTAANRGNRFARQKQYDSAEFYLNKALRLANAYNDKRIFKKNSPCML